MRGDFGLYKVNVNDHTDDDVQRRLLPLQWAVDSVNRRNIAVGVADSCRISSR